MWCFDPAIKHTTANEPTGLETEPQPENRVDFSLHGAETFRAFKASAKWNLEKLRHMLVHTQQVTHKPGY